MTIVRSTIRAAVRAAPFAVAFLALRQSNRQHSARLHTVMEIMRADCEAGARDRQQLANVAAVLCRTSGDLCAVQDRLDGIARAAAAA